MSSEERGQTGSLVASHVRARTLTVLCLCHRKMVLREEFRKTNVDLQNIYGNGEDALETWKDYVNGQPQ